MADNIIHVTEAEAARDFPGLLARIRAGAEVVIEDGHAVIATIRGPEILHRRTTSESLAIAQKREKERGYPIRMGADFANDLEEIIRNRRPRDLSKWE